MKLDETLLWKQIGSHRIVPQGVSEQCIDVMLRILDVKIVFSSGVLNASLYQLVQ